MLVEREALIAPATVAADRVLASTVQTHARELDAFIDILTLGEPFSSRAQLRVGLSAHFRAQLTPIATPGTADGTTAETLREMTFYGTSALAVTIVQVASFLPGVDASGVCKRGIGKREKYSGKFARGDSTRILPRIVGRFRNSRRESEKHQVCEEY